MILATTLLACRLTSGPPPRETATPVALQQPAAQPRATATPLPSPDPRPSLTPYLLPSATPAPTPRAFLPGGLPIISPENAAYVRAAAHLVGAEARPLAGLAFGPSGNWLATIDCNQGVKIWEIASGIALALPAQEESGICNPGLRIAVAPGGSTLAATTMMQTGEAAWGAVALFDVAPLAGAASLEEIAVEEAAAWAIPIHTLAATQKPLTSLAFSPDGSLLAAGSSEAAAHVWELPTALSSRANEALEPATLEHEDWVVDLAFSPGGETLATATAVSRGERLVYAIKLWEVAALTRRGEADIQASEILLAPHGPVWQVAFSPQGDWIAAAGGGITLWESAGGEPRLTLNLPVNRLAFAPNGRLLAAAGEDLVVLWDFKAALQAEDFRDEGLVILDRNTGRVEAIAFAPDGRSLATASNDGIVRLWGINP